MGRRVGVAPVVFADVDAEDVCSESCLMSSRDPWTGTMSQYHSKDGGALFGMEQARGAGNGTSSEERCCKLGGEQLAAA